MVTALGSVDTSPVVAADATFLVRVVHWAYWDWKRLIFEQANMWLGRPMERRAFQKAAGFLALQAFPVHTSEVLLLDEQVQQVPVSWVQEGVHAQH